MSFFQSRDGTQLHERLWPGESPRAVVLIAHGYGEHIGRYDQTARDLNAAGFTVRGLDFRGHGQSGGVRGHIARFSDYLDDLDGAIQRARGESLPLYLLGHSNGGLISAHYCIHGPNRDAISGLVLTSPFFGLALAVSPLKLWAAKVASKLAPALSLPTGLKGEHVTRDPEEQRKYDADPLNNKNATARWSTETTAAQEELERRAGELTLPLLLMAGAADPVASSATSAALFPKLGSADKTLRLLEGQRHEILNELPADRRQTVSEIVEWLRAHAQSVSGKLRAG